MRYMRVRASLHAALVAWLAAWLFACGSSEEAAKVASKPAASPNANEIHVAAASDLAFAFEAVGEAFSERTGRKVSFTYGSTGLLAKQLAEGAPFDLFAAANVSFVEDVVHKGACDGATQAPYARGRVVMWSRAGFPNPPKSLNDLADPRFARIAIANPEHAPYGKAAQQALEKLGLWDKLKPRLVYGENVSQTYQYAQSGNAEVALVALSLALGSQDGQFSEIPEQLHAPIDQALVVCNHGRNAAGAKAFAAFVNGADGRAIMQRYGFLLPGETLVQHAP